MISSHACRIILLPRKWTAWGGFKVSHHLCVWMSKNGLTAASTINNMIYGFFYCLLLHLCVRFQIRLPTAVCAIRHMIFPLQLCFEFIKSHVTHLFSRTSLCESFKEVPYGTSSFSGPPPFLILSNHVVLGLACDSPEFHRRRFVPNY